MFNSPLNETGTRMMAEHQQQKTAIADDVPAALGGFNMLVHLGRNTVLSVFHYLACGLWAVT